MYSIAGILGRAIQEAVVQPKAEQSLRIPKPQSERRNVASKDNATCDRLP